MPSSRARFWSTYAQSLRAFSTRSRTEHSRASCARLRGEGLTRTLRAATLLAGVLLASTASAEAAVVVELKRPDGSAAEGTVQLSKGEAKHRCTTDKAGRCAIAGVAGGVYTVSVEQPGKPAPKDKTVVIPPSGEVKLIVNAN